MSTEELLRPRYKVIADYPLSMHRAGDILPVVGTKLYVKGRVEFLNKYPHLFEPLPWWSDREISDMPEYLHCPSRGTYHKVSKWDGESFVTDGKTKKQLANYTPTTRAEYEQYNQQKEGKPNE